MAAEEFQFEVIKTLREHSLTYPETNEGDSCVKRAFKARNKGFVYLGETEDSYNIILKLDESIPEAKALAAAEPDHYTIGNTNWVTVNFPADEIPPKGLIEGWIDESFRLQAPKAVLAQLND
ncbi:MAG: MmcQ/YjbR family DNA-binding protein [Acidimicrobiia bacterium]